MSVWQFTAAVEGFAKKQAGNKNQMSATEAEEIWEWMNAATDIEVQAPKRAFDPAASLPIEAWD